MSDTQLTIFGYNKFMRNRPGRRGGGCVIYLKNSLTAATFDNPVLNNVQESLWLTISVNQQQLLMGCIYNAPNGSQEDLELLTLAFECAAGLPFLHKLIGGDFNLPSISWPIGTAPLKYHNLISCIQMNGWQQQVSRPTRGESTLDLIFSLGIPAISVNVLDEFPGSDHRVIKCCLRLRMADVQKTKHYRLFNSVNWDSFKDLVRSMNWDKFFLSSCPQHATDLFYSIIGFCIDSAIPLKCAYQTKPKSDRKALKAARKLHKIRQKFKLTADFALLLQQSKLVEEQRHQRDKTLILEEYKALNGPSKTAELAKLFRARGSRCSDNLSFITTPDGTYYDAPDDICEAFSAYFAESMLTESSDTPTFITPHNNEGLCTVEFTIAKITSQVARLYSSTCAGPDGIPPCLIKRSGSDFLLLLLNLFTLSFNNGVYPTQWKTSVVIPRHKNGAAHEVKNFRPINHTPIVSRIMERIVKNELFIFLNKANIISNSQHGFMQGRSCATCQTDFLNHTTAAIDNGNSVVILFLDMQKAFDRVPHRRLLNKLKAIGIGEPMFSWLSSYLIGRQQVVRIGDHFSTPKAITSGVIQGSVLGPLLFLIYINDIFQRIRNGVAFIFADDIKVVYSQPRANTQEAVRLIQDDLSALDSWCQLWQMSFAVDKCNILSYKCQVPPDSLLLQGAYISQCRTIRDLGVRYSVTFNFSEHCDFQVSKAMKTIGYICHHFYLTESRISLYKTYVLPCMEYCSMVQSNLRKSDQHALERVQRRFTKKLCGYSSKLTYKERCDKLGFDPVWLRIMKLNLCFLYRIINCRIRSPESGVHISVNSRYPIRNKEVKVMIPKFTTRIRERFFLTQYSKIWNKLPSDIRTCYTLCNFKLAISKHLTVQNVIKMFGTSQSLDNAFENGIHG
ncbi:unnamed protein product, partial [Dicrocoelium dendriticum]